MSKSALLVMLFSITSACSSTGARTDAGNGSGGSGAGGGNFQPDAEVADAGSSATPFTCGDASCVPGQTYCRVISSFGGNTGNGSPNTIYSYDCPAFNSGCPAHDCSCVTVNQGFQDCLSCSADGGAVVATCGKV